MVQGHCFNDGNRQAPDAQEAAAHFRVAGAENFLFGFPERPGLFLGQPHGLHVLFGQVGDHDELADVMQQARGENLLGSCRLGVFRAGNLAGQSAGGHRVRPEFVHGKILRPDLVKIGERVRQQ